MKVSGPCGVSEAMGGQVGNTVVWGTQGKSVKSKRVKPVEAHP